MSIPPYLPLIRARATGRKELQWFSAVPLAWGALQGALRSVGRACTCLGLTYMTVTRALDNVVLCFFKNRPDYGVSVTWLYICVVAFMVGGLIVASERWHGAFTGDSDLSKPQASHSRATPRVGGLAVLAGSLAGLLVLGPSNMTLTWLWPALFIAAMPVFVAGLLEDITKDV